MPDYTAAQAEAIACLDEPLQIIACAGSGKTQVISQRIAAILAQPGCRAAQRHRVHLHGEGGGRAQGAHPFDPRGEGVEHVTGWPRCTSARCTATPSTWSSDLCRRRSSSRCSPTSRPGCSSTATAASPGSTECPTLVGGHATPAPIHPLEALHAGDECAARGHGRRGSRAGRRAQVALATTCSCSTGTRYFDFTEMINLAVQLLEGDPDEDDAAGVVQDHIRDDIRYVVVDEYQDVNPLQERLVRGLTQFGANLCVVGDDDQTIYQWRGSEVCNIVTFEDRYAGVRQVTLDDNFRSSEGVVEVGRSVAELIPAGRPAAEGDGRGRPPAWERGDLLALDFARPGGRSGVDLRPHPGDARARVHGRARTPSRAGFRGRTARCCSARSPRTPARSSRRCDAASIPYVVKGLNRLFDSPEIQAVVGIFRYMVGRDRRATLRSAVGRRRRWSRAGPTGPRRMRVLDEGRDFDRGERWGVYNIQRLYLEFLEALELREDTVPGDAARARTRLLPARQVQPGDLRLRGRSTSTPTRREVRGVRRLARVSKRPTTTPRPTPTSATRRRTPSPSRPCTRPRACSGRRSSSRACAATGSPRSGRAVWTCSTSSRTTAIASPDRYRGTVEDETRLFYVAVTRAQKYLFVVVLARCRATSSTDAGRSSSTTAPRSSGSRPATREPAAPTLTPHASTRRRNVTLSFSELKYLFECPYQFKLRFLYGFNPPIHEALGYGKGLHDALAEVHKRALDGDLADASSGRGTRGPAPAHAVTPIRRCESDAAQGSASRRSSAISTITATTSNGPSTARSRSRCTSRPGSRSMAGSTSSGASTPTSWRSSTSSPPRAPGRGRHARPAPRLRRRLRGADRRTRRPDRGAQPSTSRARPSASSSRIRC